MPVVKVSKPDADGISGARFTCPGCKTWHVIPVTGPHAWGFNGDAERPTFTPSILVTCGHPPAEEVRENLVGRDPELVERIIADMPPNVCHSYVTDGRIEFLPDSTHDLAGKTVPLEEIGA